MITASLTNSLTPVLSLVSLHVECIYWPPKMHAWKILRFSRHIFITDFIYLLFSILLFDCFLERWTRIMFWPLIGHICNHESVGTSRQWFHRGGIDLNVSLHICEHIWMSLQLEPDYAYMNLYQLFNILFPLSIFN